MNIKAALLAAALTGLAAPAARAQEAQPAPPAPVARAADPTALRELLAAVEGPSKKKADAWHQLGIEYNLAGEIGKAREAFRQALKLRSSFYLAAAGMAYTYFAEGRLDEAEPIAERAAEAESRALRGKREARPDYVAHRVHSAIRLRRFYNKCVAALAEAEAALAGPSPDARWHLLKSRALVGMTVGPQELAPDLSPPQPHSEVPHPANSEHRKLLAVAASHLEEYLRLSAERSAPKELRAQLEALRYHAGLSADAEPMFIAREVSSKAVMTSKPEPGYSVEARDNDTEGLVRLRAVLAADGSVRHLLIVIPLRDGLTGLAMEAARRIKFRPALKDGVPVSQLVIIEYNFNIF